MNKRFFAILSFTIAILICYSTFVFCDSSIVREILKMHESGLNEETILMYLQSRNTEFELTSQDLITLKNAGFSQEFMQALLQMRKLPEYDVAPQMYDYGASYFLYSFGFSYGCVPVTCGASPCTIWGQFGTTNISRVAGQKSYFYSAGHAYIRHNGHFHIDDDHRFQSIANLNQLPENAFISKHSVSLSRGNSSLRGVSVKNRWSSKSASSVQSTWGNKPAMKTSRPAGSFHGIHSSRATGKIGFGATKVSNR